MKKHISINAIICEAITKRRLLQFRYDGFTRVVEPHLLGFDTAKHDILCAYLVRGFTQAPQKSFWRTYLTSEMKLLEMLEEEFPGPREGYNRYDKRIQKTYCSL